MSSNGAANAAALAAFNAIGKKKNDPTPSPPLFKPYTQDNNSLHSMSTIHTNTSARRTSTAKASIPAQSAKKPTTTTNSNNKYSRLKKVDTSATLQAAAQVSPSNHKQSQQRKAYASETDDENVIESPTITARRYVPESPQSPQDMIRNVRQSIELKAIPNNAQSKRISSEYAPQEMIKNLRQSINSKAKTSPALTTSDKSQHMLNEMRDRLDNTMKIASSSMANLSLSQSLDMHNPSLTNVSNSRLSYNGMDYSDSMSSFELPGDARGAPHGITIDVTHHDSDLEEEEEEDDDDDDDEDFEDFEEDETESQIERSSEIKSNNDRTPVSNRLKRKPPPGEEFKMNFNDKSSETISSGTYSLNPEDIYSINDPESTEYLVAEPLATSTSTNSTTAPSGNGKFPQFPAIKHHHHHHHYPIPTHNPLFKKKINPIRLSLDTNNYDAVDSSNVSDNEESSYSAYSRTSSPIITQKQPVQFRSTMRKENKRKDRKFMFDELKPWKNHSDLHYLTDQEKKRYEGIWVSNKGNYMNRVVTRLNGVDYESQKEQTEIVEEEHSRRAAKLSTKHLDENQNSLHDLDSVEIDQLMCGTVVKRIWKRSRLPNDNLEQIWNLVDFRRDGTLNKNEFLVGMWLVDQCLYGRKLPKQVDKMVWESLGGIGVNVNVKKKK
ncbi:Increased rDNA silencing protein 4 [Candida maltosa Xu316]|uniref:Increased rDNA silencing protein 4 n=1 Tax=Candida maltosa (strain Xu316) TaxID=1245528 RepID=M3JE33_CANMX|nr:Increased rDNA silencing protein 4 [Candida maltosa Xu316]